MANNGHCCLLQLHHLNQLRKKTIIYLKRTYSYSQKYFTFFKNINFKEKMLREGIILKYFSYILINITRGTQK